MEKYEVYIVRVVKEYYVVEAENADIVEEKLLDELNSSDKRCTSSEVDICYYDIESMEESEVDE